MVCYQHVAQFTFISHKAWLVSTRIKKIVAPSFLVTYGIPFMHGLKVRRFFESEEQAAAYNAYLRAQYAGRIVENPAFPGGQLTLF
jgi:hypothetical protein